MVGRSWHRDSLEEILSRSSESQPQLSPSPYLCLPLMSIVNISRECGWRGNDMLSTCIDPCVVCLERKCTVAAEGCLHEFCTHCALYLCSTNSISTVSHGPPGSIACPLCRHGIISFVKLPDTRSVCKYISRTSLSLTFCTCSTEVPEHALLETSLCKPDFSCARISPLGSSFRSISCQRFPSVKLRPSLCMGASDTTPSLVPRSVGRNLRNQLVRCSRSSFRCSTSENEGKRWLCFFSQSMETGSTC